MTWHGTAWHGIDTTHLVSKVVSLLLSRIVRVVHF